MSAARKPASEMIRRPLNRKRILRAAMSQADRGGLEDLSMRKLADTLGVAPMALYRHVTGRDDLVDGMIDIVFGEIELPAPGDDWRTAMRRRAIAVRDALARHRWAIGLMESRLHPGPSNLRHHDAVLASLRSGGFSVAMAAHAYSVLDSYIYGFALTRMALPFDASTDMAAMADQMLEPFPAGTYPYLVEFITEHAMRPGYDYADEFTYGLDLILEGLERMRWADGPSSGPPLQPRG